MSYPNYIKKIFLSQLEKVRQEGLFKEERYIHSQQDVDLLVEFPKGTEMKQVINMCSNNYLGLSNHDIILKAAHDALDNRGFGLSSVRFICGTQDIHRELEIKVSEFLKTEDTILFPSCLDANLGIFETILTNEDIIISDRLVHASLIDGIRLCSASHDTYKHSNMDHLEEKLLQYKDKRIKLVITDGVFSMDGDLAKLSDIIELCDKYEAMILVDDSHSTGFIGNTGRGTHEYFNVFDRVDIITTTFGKALGGASGGCVSGRKEIIEICKQRSRPYLFSNTIPPAVVSGILKAIEIISTDLTLKTKLIKNTEYWRDGLKSLGFIVKEGESPIVPIMLFDAKLTQDFSRDLFNEGIYAIGFFYPVVPMGQARIRTQLSANHEIHHLDIALSAFKKIGEKYDIIGKTKDQILSKYKK